jgi:predicted negative regulator of RcsB-dependent stress response
MATQLDLQEQEQLDQLKHFWNQYGTLITGVLIAILVVTAGWNGYQYWQRKQATQAAAMFDEVERMVRSGDVVMAERAFNDMKARFTQALYTQQAGLLVAKMAFEDGKTEVTQTTLRWVAEHSKDPAYAAIARLRLASVLLDAQSFDQALQVLDGIKVKDFLGLAADRRGDIALAQGRSQDAKNHFLQAYQQMDENFEYRRLVQYKLNALGVDPEAKKP